MRNPWIYRAPAIGWGFLISYASLAPVHDLDPGWEFQISDKWIHFLLYFSWIVLLYFGSSRAYKRKLERKKVLIYWFAAVVVGAILEFFQGAMGLGRSADIYDALANSSGAITGVIFSRIIHRFLE